MRMKIPCATQRIGSTYYNDKLQYLQALIRHICALKDRSYIVIVGGDINIMSTEDDLYNPLHPEWAIMAMISVPERNLFNEILRLGFHDIVAERLPHRPYTRWAHYSSAKDKQQGFRLDGSEIDNSSTSAHTLARHARC